MKNIEQLKKHCNAFYDKKQKDLEKAPCRWVACARVPLTPRGLKAEQRKIERERAADLARIDAAALKRLQGQITITADAEPNGAGVSYKNIVARDSFGQSVTLHEIDASYPEYSKVIPESTDATESNKVAFNPSYMADFAGYEKNDRLQIEIHGAVLPILIKNSALDNFTGVLMPVCWDAVARK